MNQETRLFIYGLFLFIVGAASMGVGIEIFHNGTDTGWTLLQFGLSMYCAFSGIDKMDKSTK